MSSNPSTANTTAPAADGPHPSPRHRLAAILPFDNVAVRYAISAWLLLSICACIAAFAYSKPQSRAALIAAHHLFDLESQIDHLDLASNAHSLSDLRTRANAIRESVFKDRLSVDQRLADIILSLRTKGWRGAVVGRSAQEHPSNDLDQFIYHLELEKLEINQAFGAASTPPPNPSTELLELLRAARGVDSRLDIDRLKVTASHAGLPKVQLTLSALATR